MSTAGIPVYPQPGRGGSWSLVGGARNDLSGLNASEAQALFLLVGPAAAVSGEAKSALRKLVRALPQTFREEPEAAAGATMIDPTRWGERHRSRPALDAGRGAGRSERVIEPWGLVDKMEARRSRTWATVLVLARIGAELSERCSPDTRL